GECVIAVAESRNLSAPGACRAADTMQEHQRRLARLAACLIGETAIFGFQRRRHGPMLTGRPLPCKSLKYKIYAEILVDPPSFGEPKHVRIAAFRACTGDGWWPRYRPGHRVAIGARRRNGHDPRPQPRSAG